MSWMKKYKKKFEVFKIIIDKQDPVILEIGAHYGEDSVRFTEIFEEADIYCFEPDPRNITIFKKHVDDSRIKLFECALSDQDGEARFFQSFQKYDAKKVPQKYDWISLEDYNKNKLNNSGSSSLKKGYDHTIEGTIIVETKRYDTWAEENEVTKVDLAWIDVQGAENLVIEGMGNKITNIDFIWIEYGETSYDGGMSKQETVALLTRKGFKVLKDFYIDQNTGDLLFYNARGTM